MRRLLAILGLFGGLVQAAEAPPEPPVPAALSFISEHAVEGMRGGNLSGLAWCGGALWTVSDRDDDRLYRLQPSAEGSDQPWQAEAESFIAPTPPDSGLPWGMSTRVWLSGLVRGGNLDFEGIACDAAGNRYLVSEAHAAVLQLPVSGAPNWLRLPPGLLPQARASGMLMNFNALFEGIAVDPEGKRLWLAAERERRGLLVAHRDNSAWRCEGSCVLLAEGGKIEPPPELGSARKLPKDFSDLAFYRGKLFTLERLAHQICRRDLAQAKVERCWSFASAVLAPERRYELPYGVAEALSLDDKGAWLGIDNGDHARADGDVRPFVLRFAAPAGGWLGTSDATGARSAAGTDHAGAGLGRRAGAGDALFRRLGRSTAQPEPGAAIDPWRRLRRVAPGQQPAGPLPAERADQRPGRDLPARYRGDPGGGAGSPGGKTRAGARRADHPEHGQRPRHGLAHAAGPAATRRYPPVRGRGADCAGHGRR